MPSDISGFFAVGINHRKTDAAIRGQFAIGNEQYAKILTLAPSFNVAELFVLSTCNRTEIYGFADNSAHLASLLCTQTTGVLDAFLELAYIRKGAAAIGHLFEVGAGLDSQILGDYEIVGQIKKAVKFARDRQFIGPFLERLVNCVLQASKAIKNETGLSGGTVSVSFAAIQYIRERVPDPGSREILLIGTGKIGRNTCHNLVDYLGTRNLTLINRTEWKATELAAGIGVRYAPAERIAECAGTADIILVATSADHPTLMRNWVEGRGEKLIIDLSIPCNVEKSVAELPGITLVNVDELSKIKDETLQKREAEIPKAKAIIAEHIAEWMDWYKMRQHVPVLRAVKTKLKELHTCPVFSRLTGEPFPFTDTIQTDEQIQRVINGMASKMRQHNRGGCQFIEAINEYINRADPGLH
jgi:glutamyl-tRNA reductase